MRPPALALAVVAVALAACSGNTSHSLTAPPPTSTSTTATLPELQPGPTTTTTSTTPPATTLTTRTTIHVTTTAAAATPGRATVLSVKGPYQSGTVNGTTYRPGGAYAATSLSAIRSEVPPSDSSTCNGTCWPDATAPAAPSLFVAGPFRSTGCDAITGVTVTVRGTTATLVSTVTNICPPGARAAALSGLSLVAVPRTALPASGRLTVVVEQSGGQTPPFQTTVTLT